MTHRVVTAAEAFAAGAAILPEPGATHPQVAIQYEALARALVECHREDRIACTDAKGPFTVEQLNRAEGWAVEIGWLP